MEFTLAELLITFLYSLILGFFLGFLYLPFHILHMLGFTKKIHFYVADILFMILCGIITFYFSLAMLEGRIRLFVIIGELIGFVTFHYTAGRLVDFFLNPMIKIFKKILKKVLKTSRKIMYNIKIKLRKVVSKAEKLKVKIWKKKRLKQKKKISLKRRKAILKR